MHLDEPVVIACTQDGRVECFGRKERQNSAQDHAICKIGRRLHVLARGKALNLIDVKEEIAPLYAIPSAAGQSHPCAACSEKMLWCGEECSRHYTRNRYYACSVR